MLPSRLGQLSTSTASLQIKTPTRNEYLGYDSKRSGGEVPVMLKFWGMWTTPSLPSLPGPLWPRVVTPDRVLSMGQIELNCVLTIKLCTYAKLNCLK